jgi:lipopolysaccharide biosynthesis glycosyltransferase
MRVFIGYDSREDIAFRVCESSIRKHSKIPIDVWPIKQQEMRMQKLYWRDHDPLASTEFSFTRFLTPYLAGYKGWALFCDCDFLFRKDISGLRDYMDPEKAVMVVKHEYNPPEKIKMDGKVQTQYTRKNWSSFMLINCEHPSVKALTPDVVNNQSGLYLHRFHWLENKHIGELPVTYNYLEGWHTKQDCDDPIAVHFTRGGPWFKDYMQVEYGDEWIEFAKRITHE